MSDILKRLQGCTDKNPRQVGGRGDTSGELWQQKIVEGVTK